MRSQQFFGTISLGLAVILLSAGPDSAKAQTSPSAALTGQVSSQEEGPMEGVLVSAKRESSTVTITVVSDAQGRYSFPRKKLEPGRYRLCIRAVGYELENPGLAEITAPETASLDLKLRKAQDLAYQLSNAEWIISMPGTEDQKKVFLGCVSCHTLERIARSRYNAAEWKAILERMARYTQATTPLRPQLLPAAVAAREAGERSPEQAARQAEYLSTVNLRSGSRWEYPLKTLPRPKGKATRVILTEYDLPRTDAMPHDAVVDSEGTVWYSDFGQQYLGRLDPRTARVVEYSVPLLKPGFPTGSNSVEMDRDGNVWLGMLRQAGISRFDKKTEKIQAWSNPKEGDTDLAGSGMVMPRYQHVDGKVWIYNAGQRRLHRLDVRLGQMETIDPYRDIPKDSPAAGRPHGAYGIASDSKNNVYLMDYASEFIGKVDAKTGQVTYYQVPTKNSAPRRGHVDAQDRLWFAQYRGNRIGMFDTRTERIQEWAIPTPWTAPYDVVADKNGEAWTGGMTTDRVARLNPKTGEWIEYLLPRSTNIRRVDVDNSTTPVTFWVGNNHGASILKLEPLE